MTEPLRKDSPRFTWADYRSWPDDERWEIIDGEAYAMSPSPTSRHQHICLQLSTQMNLCFRSKKCRVFPSPMDVKLSDTNVVQPDVLVVCNPQQIKPTHIEG